MQARENEISYLKPPTLSQDKYGRIDSTSHTNKQTHTYTALIVRMYKISFFFIVHRTRMNPTLSAKEERQNHILHGKKKLKKLLFSFKEITCDLR